MKPKKMAQVIISITILIIFIFFITGCRLRQAVQVNEIFDKPFLQESAAHAYRVYYIDERRVSVDNSTVKREIEAWNCLGLEGEWQLRVHFHYEGMKNGTLSAETTFIMPPRPEDGPWESLPFDLNLIGKLYIDFSPLPPPNKGDETVYVMRKDNVITITTSDPGTAEEPLDDELPLVPLVPELPLTPLVPPSPDDELPLTPLVPQKKLLIQLAEPENALSVFNLYPAENHPGGQRILTYHMPQVDLRPIPIIYDSHPSCFTGSDD